MKAQIGDYIRKDGYITKITGIESDYDGFVCYHTEDGGVIADSELSYDDILLESEVE